MNADPFTNQLLVGIILAIVGHAITVLVKSPKEAIKELTTEVGELREKWARHDEISKGLDASVRALSARIDRLEPFVSKTHGSRRGA